MHRAFDESLALLLLMVPAYDMLDWTRRENTPFTHPADDDLLWTTRVLFGFVLAVILMSLWLFSDSAYLVIAHILWTLLFLAWIGIASIVIYRRQSRRSAAWRLGPVDR